MPNRNGTGPRGRGRKSGRRQGDCRNPFKNKSGNYSFWRALIMPIIGFIANDIKKESSFIKRFIRKIGYKKNPDNSNRKKIHEAEYEIIDDKKISKEEK